jgi:hypothetical protein
MAPPGCKPKRQDCVRRSLAVAQTKDFENQGKRQLMDVAISRRRLLIGRGGWYWRYA